MNNRRKLTRSKCHIFPGKIFLELKIIEVLLKYIKLNLGFVRSPVLVERYPSHLLDQPLEGTLSITYKIVRVEGQSESGMLQMPKRNHEWGTVQTSNNWPFLFVFISGTLSVRATLTWWKALKKN